MISYGLPLIYFHGLPVTLRLPCGCSCCSLAPPRGSHEEKRQHYDDEDSQQERPRAVQGERELVLHGINRNVLYTDGVHYVAEHGGAHWLLDEIAIIQPYNKAVAAEEFQVWKLAVRPDRSATLTCDDGNGTSCVPRRSSTRIPLGRNYAVLREQRDPSAERITSQS